MRNNKNGNKMGVTGCTQNRRCGKFKNSFNGRDLSLFLLVTATFKRDKLSKILIFMKMAAL